VAAQAGPHAEDYSYLNIGAMVRSYIPVNEWFEFTLQWDLNVMSFFQGSKFKDNGNLYGSPLRIGGLVNLTDRAYVRTYGSVNTFANWGLGWAGEVGVRF
jgi:hypothetical protein